MENFEDTWIPVNYATEREQRPVGKGEKFDDGQGFHEVKIRVTFDTIVPERSIESLNLLLIHVILMMAIIFFGGRPPQAEMDAAYKVNDSMSHSE